MSTCPLSGPPSGPVVRCAGVAQAHRRPFASERATDTDECERWARSPGENGPWKISCSGPPRWVTVILWGGGKPPSATEASRPISDRVTGTVPATAANGCLVLSSLASDVRRPIGKSLGVGDENDQNFGSTLESLDANSVEWFLTKNAIRQQGTWTPMPNLGVGTPYMVPPER